jgi:hypothetical protein
MQTGRSLLKYYSNMYHSFERHWLALCVSEMLASFYQTTRHLNLENKMYMFISFV